MEKEFKDLIKFIQERSSEMDLDFEKSFMSRLLYIFDLMGVKALVILEKEGNDMCILENEISYAALMTFLTNITKIFQSYTSTSFFTPLGFRSWKASVSASNTPESALTLL